MAGNSAFNTKKGAVGLIDPLKCNLLLDRASALRNVNIEEHRMGNSITYFPKQLSLNEVQTIFNDFESNLFRPHKSNC